MPLTNSAIVSTLENIYISPLELCNLNCKHCYTNKTRSILTNRQIHSFIRRYRRHIDLKSILFCGGEVFTLKNFPRLVNKFIKQGLFISIITNATIDRLGKIHDPKNCQLLVSLDGPQSVHDANRGPGNFTKTLNFIRHALSLGFPLEIMFLVTPQSYPHRRSLPKKIAALVGQNLRFNYMTQKTIYYTQNHPLSNQNNTLPALTEDQIIDIKTNFTSIPSPDFGCFQLALQSDGRIYGCCESPYPLSSLSDPIKVTLKRFLNSLIPCQSCPLHKSKIVNPKSPSCGGCTAPDFLCGYKKELQLLTCQEVVTAFHKTKP